MVAVGLLVLEYSFVVLVDKIVIAVVDSLEDQGAFGDLYVKI